MNPVNPLVTLLVRSGGSGESTLMTQVVRRGRSTLRLRLVWLGLVNLVNMLMNLMNLLVNPVNLLVNPVNLLVNLVSLDY